MIPTLIYGLCLLGSAACAWLLMRSYLESREPLLFWSAICFGLIGLNNLLVFADLLVFPAVDLLVWRRLSSLAAVSALLFGFIWRSE